MKEIKIYSRPQRETRGGSDLWGAIDASILHSEVQEIICAVSPSFLQPEEEASELVVQEVEIEIAVTATGKVGLFGSGVEAEGAAKIKVKLGRS
ncbi:hypothetical protein [uncultured Roseobacter sp.]|uniref:Pepco domain-containing protein n=1 Tax=uncultured Roseobacter sp. TaxID=114847 RepID=UPI002620479B|nr:hypothetical protein [uncultured Roseobacter sp.]